MALEGHVPSPQVWVVATQIISNTLGVATLLWPSVGVKPNTWKKLGLELLQP
jgi:hypothetical protein